MRRAVISGAQRQRPCQRTDTMRRCPCYRAGQLRANARASGTPKKDAAPDHDSAAWVACAERHLRPACSTAAGGERSGRGEIAGDVMRRDHVVAHAFVTLLCRAAVSTRRRRR